MIGTTLQNRYRIESELGHGGMGTVYRGYDLLLDRPVAVKVVSNTALGTEGRARLLREARAVAKLNHPNIMAVHDAGEVDGTPFIVMELIEGQTLRQLPAPPSVKQTIEMAQQICAALEHAHVKGIIHRDLKPENVMVLQEDRVKLMDFGLAFSTGASRLTQEDMLVGTVAYLAPELIEGQPASVASDLYALGVMLYELLAGQLPFSGDNLAALLSQHLYALVTPASIFNSKITPTLDLLLMRLLAKKPAQRPASALEVRQILEKIGAGEGVAQPAVETPRTNLPAPLTSFIGRAKELARIQEKLADYRLVTLTGSGGVGKTRLALQAAQSAIAHYPDGAWLIELAPLADPALVPHTLAATLGLQETGGRPIVTALIDVLREKQRLLIFDNCEHLIEACAQLVETLLQACPHLHILATSRETLDIDGEVALRVPSLSLPPADTAAPEALAQSEAAQLFVDRAAAALPGFALTASNAPAIAQVCRRLDGIALALELAASRVKVLKVEQIANRLDDAFRLLTGGRRTALPRQQTLRATIDWSYNLLTEVERTLLRRLAVFAGGATLEAVEAICADNVGADEVGADPRVGPGADTRVSPYVVLDVLTQLVNKSLVVAEREQGAEARYALLETIRQYAREKLNDSGEGETVRERHTRWYVALAERAEPELVGPDQFAWFDRLEAEFANIRTALDWSLTIHAEMGLRLTTALRWFWRYSIHVNASSEYLSRLLQLSTPQVVAPPIRAKALAVQSELMYLRAEFPQSQQLAEESLALCRTANDEQGETLALLTLARAFMFQGQNQKAQSLFEDSLALSRVHNEPICAAEALYWLSFCEPHGRPCRSELLEEAQAIFRAHGHWGGILWTLNRQITEAISQGDYVLARRLNESLDLTQRPTVLAGLLAYDIHMNLGRLGLYEGDYGRAWVELEKSAQLMRDAGLIYKYYWSLAFLGYAALRQGDLPLARTNWEKSLPLFRAANVPGGVVFNVEGLASLAVQQQRPDRAARLFAWADALREAINDSRLPVEQTDVDRDLAVIHAQLDDATFQAEQAAGRKMTLDEAIEYALNEV